MDPLTLAIYRTGWCHAPQIAHQILAVYLAIALRSICAKTQVGLWASIVLCFERHVNC